MAAVLADSILPAMHITVYPTLMPVHADMFGIRETGNKETRSGKGTMACNKASDALPSMGRKRLRPGTITAARLQNNKRKDNR